MGIKIRFYIAFCIVIVLVGSGLALLTNMHLREPAYAARNLPESDLSVVGPPSLPASAVDSISALPAISKLRRTQLMPALPPTSDQLQEVPVPTGARPSGLLARYGNPPDHSGDF